MSFQKVSEKLRIKQNPQLSASRPVYIKTEFNLVRRHIKGTKRAVMIAINYAGKHVRAVNCTCVKFTSISHGQGELNGRHNNVKAMRKIIAKEHSFEKVKIKILMDHGDRKKLTEENIRSAYKKLVNINQLDAAIFFTSRNMGGK